MVVGPSPCESRQRCSLRWSIGGSRLKCHIPGCAVGASHLDYRLNGIEPIRLIEVGLAVGPHYFSDVAEQKVAFASFVHPRHVRAASSSPQTACHRHARRTSPPRATPGGSVLAPPFDWLGAMGRPTAAVWLVHEAPALARLRPERLGVVVHGPEIQGRRATSSLPGARAAEACAHGPGQLKRTPADPYRPLSEPKRVLKPRQGGRSLKRGFVYPTGLLRQSHQSYRSRVAAQRSLCDFCVKVQTNLLLVP